MTDPIIEAANVSKSFGSGPARVLALNDVNLTLDGGKLTVLMGPSGSGKTTLLSILGCMLAPTSGTVRICGTSASGVRPEELARIRRQHIGFVFQSYHLFSTLTVAENVLLALDVRGERGPQAMAKTAEVVASVGLASKMGVVPAPAQRRRAAAGRDRARHRGRAFSHPGRRADRRARCRQWARHHGDSDGDRQGARPRRSGGDPRSAAVRVRRPDRSHRGRRAQDGGACRIDADLSGGGQFAGVSQSQTEKVGPAHATPARSRSWKCTTPTGLPASTTISWVRLSVLSSSSASLTS